MCVCVFGYMHAYIFGAKCSVKSSSVRVCACLYVRVCVCSTHSVHEYINTHTHTHQLRRTVGQAHLPYIHYTRLRVRTKKT